MKTITKALFIFIFVFICGTPLLVQNQVKIDKQRAWQIIKEQVLKYNYEDVNVYVGKNVLSANEELEKIRKINSPSYSSFFFFIDEVPCANWAHPCKYCFVNVITGDVEIIDSDFPPDLENMEILHFIELPPEGKLFDFSDYTIKETKDGTRENDYAVIISGGINKGNNWKRYWNDCSAIYSALVNIYGYYDDHIYVFMSDGTSSGEDRKIGEHLYDSSPLDLDGDGDNDINYSATKSNITTLFTYNLKNRLNANDHLFIFTTNHGGRESGDDVFICLWGDEEIMRDDEFAAEVNKIDAGRINITMEQCRSGGFIDDLESTNRVIATACEADEYSHGMGYYTYDEFVYYWISAVAGETPEGDPVDADTNNDGWVSMREAFLYAQSNDTKDETPQYNSTPDGLGCLVSLDPYFWYITGPDPELVCYSPGETFTLHDSPPGISINWTYDLYMLYPVNGQGTNNFTVRARTPYVSGDGWVQANISTSNCDDVPIREDIDWVGVAAQVNPETIEFTCAEGEGYLCTNAFGNEVSFSYSYDYNYFDIKLTNWSETQTLCQFTIYGTEGSMDLCFPTPSAGTYKFWIRGNNDCGTGNWSKTAVDYVVCHPWGLNIFPNPTTGETTVSIVSSNDKTSILNDNEEWHLEVYTQSKLLKLTRRNIKGNKYIINTSGWQTGVYFVQVYYKDEILTETLIVE